MSKEFKDLNEGDVFRLTYCDTSYRKVECLEFITQNFVSVNYIGIAVEDTKYYKYIKPADDTLVIVEPS